MEIKTRSTVGTKREERKERGGWRRILGFTRRSRSSRRYRSILARRTLSSYLAFNDLSTHQIPDPPSLSSDPLSIIFPRGPVSTRPSPRRACHALQKAIVRAIFSRRSPRTARIKKQKPPRVCLMARTIPADIDIPVKSIIRFPGTDWTEADLSDPSLLSLLSMVTRTTDDPVVVHHPPLSLINHVRPNKLFSLHISEYRGRIFDSPVRRWRLNQRITIDPEFELQ